MKTSDILSAARGDQVIILDAAHTRHVVRHGRGDTQKGGWHVWMQNGYHAYCGDFWTDEHRVRSLIERARMRGDGIELQDYREAWPTSGRQG